MHILGLDVGGSGIKGAIIDVTTGALVTPRHRIPTPEGAEPAAVATTVAHIIHDLNWSGPVGCGFPAVIKAGVAHTAANIAPSWVGLDVARLFSEVIGHPVLVLNDADAAGIAEMRLGAGRSHSGLVLLITIGTGLGTALFMNGQLVPNTELGHIEIRGKEAELRASEAVRDAKHLSWSDWAKRFDEYLHRVSALIWPDLIILGGGGSRSYEKFAHHLTVGVEIVPAQLRNEAGMIGAALAAAEAYPELLTGIETE
ncbi:ROK family protein [Oscillochloris trichoides DG-6]|uniref:ROK family protein n=1 Tax=Oscillochloris trichoides DG-6 TaxID=765420 RepID=E1IBU4_9CHLR|nr:ROK family protein [Oscillochloris trichoides]EFO81324.1 ROK family protein [Oscillochloris trichoides DG-6]